MSQHIIGFTCDGGYAEAMLVRATGLVSIPDELSSVEAAPVLCAGLATFNALRKSGAQAGDTVAILGIGGLGHMAVQYARRMGFKVIALGRGQEIAEQAILLGAHTYIDTSSEDTVSALIAAGGAQAILSTIGDMSAVSVLIEGLAPGGKLIQLGVGKELMTVRSGLLVGGELGIFGSLTGTPFEAERALKFSVMAEIKPVIEIMSLDQANEALQRVRSGDATFRVVLDLTNSYVTSPRITYSENEFK
jgi:alcohol dehydrogenase